MHLAWIIAAVFIVGAVGGAIVIVRTGWLQSRTMEKCIGLSLMLHGVLAVVANFVGGWLPASWGTLDDGRMTMVVMLADEAAVDDTRVDSENLADEPPSKTPENPPELEEVGPSDDAPPMVPLAAAEPPAPPPDVVPLLDAGDAEPRDDPRNAKPPTPSEIADGRTAPASGVPAVYADRIGSRRTAAAMARGGSQETEQAVQTALAWLAPLTLLTAYRLLPALTTLPLALSLTLRSLTLTLSLVSIWTKCRILSLIIHRNTSCCFMITY
jgi:hypothetical protein